jgi:hypothetical protein
MLQARKFRQMTRGATLTSDAHVQIDVKGWLVIVLLEISGHLWDPFLCECQINTPVLCSRLTLGGNPVLKGKSASNVTIHGDTVVPKFFPLNGPRGVISKP